MNYSVQQAKDLAEKIANDNPSMANSACLVCAPEIGCTTGRITLRDAETVVDGQKVKSTALNGADLAVFPVKKLQPFNNLRVAAKRLFQNHTVQIGDLYLCPVEKLADVLAGVEELREKFEGELTSLQANYDSLVEDHKQNLPEVAHLIERNRLPWGQFSAPFKFKVNPPLAIRPLFDEDAEMLQSSAADTLWDEVAADAANQYKTSFAGKEKISQKGINAVKRLRSKLVNLSFLHDGIDRVVDRFDELFDKLPKAGYCEGGDFHMAAHFVLQISDAQRLRDEAEGLNGITALEVEEEQEELNQQEEDVSVTAETQMLAAETGAGEGIEFSDDADLEPEVDLATLVAQAQSQVTTSISSDDWGGF
ncbi:DUF3150 domain-containing protein [Rheinheimera hassiensis]|uniref:DUF3150 domain-containing protein n=1 Tax=Rheinheimera hassiensis TaxID=1193627 RepID=UPI001F051484|nr:DUF3150 domain-containing protein [Rheinheimera hassiensis]